MAAPLDNARAVLDLLLDVEMAVYRSLHVGPIKRLVARFARAQRFARTQRLNRDLFLKAQSLKYNTTGEARAQDFLFDVAPEGPLGPLRGSGQWKKWTPHAVLRAAFAPSSHTSRACVHGMGWRSCNSAAIEAGRGWSYPSATA